MERSFSSQEIQEESSYEEGLFAFLACLLSIFPPSFLPAPPTFHKVSHFQMTSSLTQHISRPGIPDDTRRRTTRSPHKQICFRKSEFRVVGNAFKIPEIRSGVLFCLKKTGNSYFSGNTALFSLSLLSLSLSDSLRWKTMPHRLLRLSRPSFVRERNGWTVLTERDPQFKRITTKCPFKREPGKSEEQCYFLPIPLSTFALFVTRFLPTSASLCVQLEKERTTARVPNDTPLLLNSNVIFEVDFKESGSEGVKKLRCKNMCCVMISWKARLQHF